VNLPHSGTSAWAPLNYPTFREIWFASLASNFGSLIQSVGAAWLMTSITGSADMVALVQASTTLPVMIFCLTAGAIADNYNRRTVMLTAQFFMFAVSLALAVITYLGWITPWSLLAFTFLIGCGTALNNPAWQASVNDMMPRDLLPAAVSLNSINFNSTRSIGPAIGGAIVAFGGAPLAFLVNAFSYMPLLLAIFRWKPVIPSNSLPPESIISAMTSGLRYVGMSPQIEKVLLRGFLFGFGGISLMALLPLVARDLPAGGPLLYGALLGCFGVGAVIGGIVNARIRERWSNEQVARGSFVVFAISNLVTALVPNAIVVGFGIMLAGACWLSALAMFNVTVQLSTPRWVLARALALYQTATFGGMSLGSWIWGVVAEEQGITISFICSSVALLVGALVGLRVTLPNIGADNLDPLDSWRPPHTLLNIQGRSGPIAIMIEYKIREEDTDAFLDAMNERKRIRRRDGARNWELLRDTEHPDEWMEMFHVPTWNDYVRHNQRRTHADAGIGQKINGLHAGDTPPKVHRMIVRPTDTSDHLHHGKTSVDMG
jgi:MFS family permease